MNWENLMRATPRYLSPVDDDWISCLEESFAFLRQSWKQNWVGLPWLLEQAITFLGTISENESPVTRSLLAAARAVAHGIELQKGASPFGPEPLYHNRLHYADALLCITLQIALERKLSGIVDSEWSAALQLIAVAHDLHHPGTINSYQAQIEHGSMNALRGYLVASGVPDVWIEKIQIIILRTDFSIVKDNHARVKDRPFSWDIDWATVLINEADIMASVSGIVGPELGESLAREWKLIDFAPHAVVATPRGRRGFISSVQFSSPSSGVLQTNDRIAAQLVSLGCPCA